MTTDELVKINKNYFKKSSLIAAKTAVYGAFPYLNVLPISLIINQAIDWLVEKIADGLELSAFFVFIDMRVDAQGKVYVKAAHEAELLQTEEARKKADEAFKLFINFKS